MYTFGRGQYGQLGHGTFLFQVDLPKPLDHFWDNGIKRVACGENHTAVITGMQYLCTASVQIQSCVLFYPEGFVCFFFFFFIVIGSGLLYTFGGGHYGKLGLEEENFVNRFSPMLCTCFLKYNVEFVSIFIYFFSQKGNYA